MELRNAPVYLAKELPFDTILQAVERSSWVLKVPKDEAIREAVTLKPQPSRLLRQQGIIKPRPSTNCWLETSSSAKTFSRKGVTSSKGSFCTTSRKGKKFWRFLTSLSAAGGRQVSVVSVCLGETQGRGVDAGSPPLQVLYTFHYLPLMT